MAKGRSLKSFLLLRILTVTSFMPSVFSTDTFAKILGTFKSNSNLAARSRIK